MELGGVRLLSVNKLDSINNFLQFIYAINFVPSLLCTAA